MRPPWRATHRQAGAGGAGPRTPGMRTVVLVALTLALLSLAFSTGIYSGVDAAGTEASQTVAIGADPLRRLSVTFGQPGGPAVMRKVQGYNSGLVKLNRYIRDLPLVARLGFDTMRVDVGLGWPGVVKGSHMGGIFGRVIAGNATGMPTYNTTVVLELSRLLHRYGMTPLYSWAYVAAPFQSRPDDFTSVPRDLSAWRAMHTQLLAPIKAAGLLVISEMYNEPDLSWSFAGNWSDYLDMYEAGCKGVIDSNPNGLVVGPATAISSVANLQALLHRVEAKKLRMDALTIHSYGDASAWQAAIARARTALANNPDVSSSSSLSRPMPISINEFNVLSSGTPSASQLLNSHVVAPLMLSALKDLLNYPDVTTVHWAQTLDSGAGDSWGLITEDGHVKASYNALWLFERLLPAAANQSAVAVDTGGDDYCIGTIASANSSHAALLVWQPMHCDGEPVPASTAMSVSLALDPTFGTGRNVRGTLWEISASSASYFDNRSSEWLEPVAWSGVRRGHAEWEGRICTGCVLAFAFEVV